MLGNLFWLAVVALDIWAIVNVLRSRSSGGIKLAWSAGIFFFPILGFITWYVAGPKDQKLLPRR